MANPAYKMAPIHRLTVSSLLSPPEMKRSESFGSSIAPAFVTSLFSSFNSRPSTAATFDDMAYASKILAYASPPISPYDTQSQKENMEYVDGQATRDPQLFTSGASAAPISLDEPLFPQETTSADVITKHMQSAQYARLPAKPSRADYEAIGSFVFQSRAWEMALANPRQWWIQEQEFLKSYRKESSVTARKQAAPKNLAPAPSARPRLQKVASVPLSPRPARVHKPKRTPRIPVYDSFDGPGALASPKPARVVTNRDDTDYHALPDYCPPLDSLPKGNSKVLKAEWKGTKLDLSNDPDRHMLHEAELDLAATLRLNCATYLCSKRRVFMARINGLKTGKEFRKTDAQQACKIDVNKASKLWQAYDKAGWFNPNHFGQYL
jgi:hypothetical protein